MLESSFHTDFFIVYFPYKRPALLFGIVFNIVGTRRGGSLGGGGILASLLIDQRFGVVHVAIDALNCKVDTVFLSNVRCFQLVIRKRTYLANIFTKHLGLDNHPLRMCCFP